MLTSLYRDQVSSIFRRSNVTCRTIQTSNSLLISLIQRIQNVQPKCSGVTFLLTRVMHEFHFVCYSIIQFKIFFFKSACFRNNFNKHRCTYVVYWIAVNSPFQNEQHQNSCAHKGVNSILFLPTLQQMNATIVSYVCPPSKQQNETNAEPQCLALACSAANIHPSVVHFPLVESSRLSDCDHCIKFNAGWMRCMYARLAQGQVDDNGDQRKC